MIIYDHIIYNHNQDFQPSPPAARIKHQLDWSSRQKSAETAEPSVKSHRKWAGSHRGVAAADCEEEPSVTR